jgi:hypothetical protein
MQYPTLTEATIEASFGGYGVLFLWKCPTSDEKAIAVVWWEGARRFWSRLNWKVEENHSQYREIRGKTIESFRCVRV